ncbi:MAG: hypothetical protein QXS42_00505 [Zestosphaera sp.]
MGFESRYHRFSCTRSMSFTSERLYGPLQVKHAAYLALSVLAGWRGLTLGSGVLLASAAITAFLGLVSAVVGVKTMSFEGKVVTTLISMFDTLPSRRGKRVKRKPKPQSRPGKLRGRRGVA